MVDEVASSKSPAKSEQEQVGGELSEEVHLEPVLKQRRKAKKDRKDRLKA